MTDLHILGLAGSLRQASRSKALLRNAQRFLPAGTTLSTFDLAGLPMLNADEMDPPPESVVALRAAIEQADALFIATPEYNYGIPAVLKNALDWASRPAFRSPLKDKPVAFATVTPGYVGGARVSHHLRDVLFGVRALVLPTRETLFGRSGDLFDDDLVLVNERVQGELAATLADLREWTLRVR